MKNGSYRVSFEVDLTGYENEQEANEAIKGMVEEMLSEDTFPEVNFELIEEFEPDYFLEEDTGVEELDFEEAVWGAVTFSFIATLSGERS